MALSDKRQQWLRGAYLDRITETAMHFAEGRTHFVDAEWLDYIGDEFGHLTELTAEDHAYLREQSGLEAFRRIVVALSAAREAAFVMLRVDNSDVVNVESRFAIGIGWVGLLQHAADRLRTYPKEWNAALTGGKEKFGCCVLYVDCDYGARGCRSEVERLREEVRLRSLSTCEVCGNAGRLRLAGFAKTVCDKHVGILGDLREDDGLWADPWKWHEDGDEYPAEAAELLKDLEPVRPRPKEHVVDHAPPRSEVGKQLALDLERLVHQQSLLIEFAGALEVAVVAAMNVADEHVDDWLRDEVERLQVAHSLLDDDRDWLHRYLRNLVIDEGVRRKRQSGD